MADGTPYNLDKEISSLCTEGLRPSVLTGVILRLITRHFSVERGIQHPKLKSYIWNRDPRTTKILIVPVWRWLTLSSQLRPAIVVKRNALRPRQLGISDGEAVTASEPRSDTDRIPLNQEAISQIAVAGSHTIFALANEADAAEILSTEVWTRLMQYQQAIQTEFGFHRFRVAEIGPISKLEEASEDFVVPITVAYAYIEAWSVWSSSPFLKRIAFETNS